MMAITVVCESFVAGAERPLAWLQPSRVWLHFHHYEECAGGLADIVMTKEWLSTSMVLSHLQWMVSYLNVCQVVSI